MNSTTQPSASAGKPAATRRTDPSSPAGIAKADLPSGAAERFRAMLRDRVGSHRFELWFEHGTTVAVGAGSIRIEASNAYVADWIGRHFREATDAIAVELLGGGAQVSIAVAPEAETAAPKQVRPAAAPDREPHAEPSGAAESRRRSRSGQAPSSAASARQRIASMRRLEDFVIGESNRLAHAAAEQLGDGSREAPPILFIHGECGVGKTHLIQGICRRRIDRAPRQIVRYVTAEQFTNEYIAAVRDGSLEEFRRRLRRVDLLAIDDIHFFANKAATQAEFLHTIDAIDLSGSQVALVSDEHPRHIRRFSQSLVSRFLSGMVVKVERPDRGTRVELVRRLARERGLLLSGAAEDAVAGRCAGSIREIEGAVTRLGALIELDGMRGQIGPGTIERFLGDEGALSAGATPVRLGSIIETVCDRIRVTREDLLGSGRHARTVVARGLVAHLARELTTHSYPEIARALGRDTHSAVHTAAKRLRLMLDQDQRIEGHAEPIREVVDQLRHDLTRPGRVRTA
ncbi:MAG: DnaA ATPase domain-containing protein [Planctomycetota bacterium]